MVNIQAFTYALKATCVRRLITSDCEWQDYITKYISLKK